MNIDEHPNFIRIIQKEPPGETIEGNYESIKIGRKPDSLIHIPELRVSWEHGRIVYQNDAYYYQHLSNNSKTVINRRGESREFEPGEKTDFLLLNEDRIKIGSYYFVIKVALHPSQYEYRETVPDSDDHNKEAEKFGVETMLLNKSISHLHKKIADAFSIEELKDLCFTLNIDSENLNWKTKIGFARELVSYCKRIDKYDILIKSLVDQRPQVEW